MNTPNAINVNIRKLTPDATLPTYATEGAAAFDLYAATDGLIPPGTVAKIPIGIAFEVPDGYVMIVAMRSGIAFNTPLRQPNAPAIIDSDYRGEVAMLLDNTEGYEYDDETGDALYGREVSTLDGETLTWDIGQAFPLNTYLIRKGDRVGQAFIQPLPRVEFTEVAELCETVRGAGGFGSTGIVA